MNLRKIGIHSVTILALYPLTFMVLFDPFSSPCRIREQWIGPKLRFDENYIDIGKAFEYQKERSIPYFLYSPLCKTWLYLQALS